MFFIMNILTSKVNAVNIIVHSTIYIDVESVKKCKISDEFIGEINIDM